MSRSRLWPGARERWGAPKCINGWICSTPPPIEGAAIRDDERDDEHDEGLRAYEIDEDTVRVNNPDPDEPDKIVRRLASGEVKSYNAHKDK